MISGLLAAQLVDPDSSSAEFHILEVNPARLDVSLVYFIASRVRREKSGLHLEQIKNIAIAKGLRCVYFSRCRYFYRRSENESK